MNELVCTLNSIDSALAAAWVQAIGAIAALGVAIYVSYLQHKNNLAFQATQSQEKIIRSLAVAVSLGGGVLAKVKLLVGWAISSNPNQHAVNIDFLLAEVKSLTNDLVSIDLNEIDNFDALQSISTLKTLSNLSCEAIRSVATLMQNNLSWNHVAIAELNRVIPEFVDAMNKAVDLEKALTRKLAD